MAPAKHSTQDEAAFLNDLLSGLDNSFWNAVPSPDPPSVKPGPSRQLNTPSRQDAIYDKPHVHQININPGVRSPSKIFSAGDVDVSDLTVDDSFWDAVPTPDPSPVKRGFSTPLKASLRPHVTQSHVRESNPRLPPSVPVPSEVSSGPDIDMVALVEGAEDWDWGDMEADFLTPKKEPVRKPAQPSVAISYVAPYARETCTRCIVESVAELDVDGRFQKNLKVRLDPGDERRSVILRDDWTTTDICIGDTINILGSFTPISPPSSSVTSSIIISSKHNLLVLHPDLLLTATALSNASQCRRKPLLSNLVRSLSDTPALVWGNMLHEVMQACLSSGNWEDSWIDERIEEVVRMGLADLIKINIGVDQAKREVKMRAKGLREFSQKYIAETPKPKAILTNTRSSHNQTSLLAISELHNVEEDIWSPTYGLKGKLDATVQAVISDPNPPFPRTITSGPQPLEIKTGRAVAGMEHRAQTMLYTLLTAERYGVEVPSGLLYYTQSEEVVRVPTIRNELRGLIGARNEMAGYMVNRTRKSEPRNVDEQAENRDLEDGPAARSFLPPTIDDERVCKRCYALDICMLYRKAVENVTDTNSPIADTYELKTAHLTPPQTSFFKKWEALLALEEQDLVRFKKELWTMGASEREAKGRCFSFMVIDPSHRLTHPKTSGSRDNKIHQFTYKFVRVGGGAPAASLLNGHMSEGDAITVSVEPNLLALARGFIVELTPVAVVVGVDHELSLDTITSRLAVLRNSRAVAQVIFRIDKDELFGGMGRIRDNLAQLFYVDGDTRRLELVVDLKTPVFGDIDPTTAAPSPALEQYSAHLNPNQRQAMSKVLTAHDYSLILGMPGTGKTTVIATIIKTLVGMGKTVLLTSYTHSAVDTILLKLKDDADFGILRLGNVDKIHPDVQRFTLATRRTANTIEQLEHQLMTPPVVATTCLSIDHALFTRRTFDYCIVDEASQITLPTCLGPLRFADKFVLVGDHFQLPPLVRNRDARKGGLDVSLFRRLSDAHPHAVVDLAYQYRMNEDIMFLSNKLIYGDRLRCGSDVTAKRTLVLPDRQFLRDLHSGKSSCHSDGCWLERLMSESCKAIFVDTDRVPARDSRIGDLVQNEVEATLVYQVTETLLRSGIRQDQIGIISLYRQQIKLLSHRLQDRKDVEILTADRSQGRDKDCIIISMVRSNDAGQIGDLVKDWRRMNVSFTRARSKLIIFGSRKTLQASPLLAEFFNLVESRDWILRLPPNAETIHSHLIDPGSRSGKREADDLNQKENLDSSVGRPYKKLKLKKTMAEDGVLRGRPILQDLVNGDK